MTLPGARLIVTGSGAGLLASQMVENSPTVQELWVQCMGQEDPLEESMATHSSIPARRIPWTGEPGGLQSTGLQRVGQDWATQHAGVQGPKGEMRAGKVSEGPGGSGAECLLPGWGDLCRRAVTRKGVLRGGTLRVTARGLSSLGGTLRSCQLD